MIFKSSMDVGKSRCDIPNDTTQRWVCPLALVNNWKLSNQHLKKLLSSNVSLKK